MTLEEIVKDLQYDVSIYFIDDDEEGFGWKWDINGGYSSVGGRHIYKTPNEALDELLRFVETFEPFEK